MSSKERVRKILNFELPDRVGIWDAYWPETLQRWQKEGLPEEIDPREYFEHDIYHYRIDITPGFQEKIIEEKDEWVIHQNRYGVIEKVWKNKEGVPFQIEQRIKDRHAWKKHKNIFSVGEAIEYHKKEFEKNYRLARKKEKIFLFTFLEPFENTHRFFGMEKLLLTMKEEPDFVVEMFEFQANLLTELISHLLDMGYDFDGVFVGGDMAYSNGLLFSPQTYKNILFPSHKKIFTFCHSRGLPVIYHGDGDMRQLIPLLLEAGINGIQPLEAKAGFDVCEMKHLYNKKLILIGNIDVRKMSGSKKEIEGEIERKVTAAKQDGGYIYFSDHSIPPTVSLENYKFVLECVKKYGKY